MNSNVKGKAPQMADRRRMGGFGIAGQINQIKMYQYMVIV